MMNWPFKQQKDEEDRESGFFFIHLTDRSPVANSQPINSHISNISDKALLFYEKLVLDKRLVVNSKECCGTNSMPPSGFKL